MTLTLKILPIFRSVHSRPIIPFGFTFYLPWLGHYSRKSWNFCKKCSTSPTSGRLYDLRLTWNDLDLEALFNIRFASLSLFKKSIVSLFYQPWLRSYLEKGQKWPFMPSGLESMTLTLEMPTTTWSISLSFLQSFLFFCPFIFLGLPVTLENTFYFVKILDLGHFDPITDPKRVYPQLWASGYIQIFPISFISLYPSYSTSHNFCSITHSLGIIKVQPEKWPLMLTGYDIMPLTLKITITIRSVSLSSSVFFNCFVLSSGLVWQLFGKNLIFSQES